MSLHIIVMMQEDVCNSLCLYRLHWKLFHQNSVHFRAHPFICIAEFLNHDAQLSV